MKSWMVAATIVVLSAGGCAAPVPPGPGVPDRAPAPATAPAPDALGPSAPAPGSAAPAPAPAPAKAPPPLTAQDRVELIALARRIWVMAGRADEAGILALLAPDEQLTMPGGEFMAEGEAPGLKGILNWAVERSRAAVLSAAVVERKPYAYMDAVILHTSSGDFAVYVTISDRKLVKLFGAAIFDAP